MEGPVKSADLSCRFRDAMVDFLPFVLEARFQKVNANPSNKLKVRNEPFNRNGYNRTAYLQCGKGCDGNDCLIDEFSAEKYTRSLDNCEIGYLQYLRHSVEELFPLDILNETCNRPLKGPTENNAGLVLYDDLRGVGVFVSKGNSSGSTDKKLFESVVVTRDFFHQITDGAKDFLEKTGKAAESVGKYIIELNEGKDLLKTVQLIGTASKMASKFIPFAALVIDLVDTLVNIYSTEPDLNSELMDKVIKEVLRLIQQNDNSKIEVFMRTV